VMLLYSMSLVGDEDGVHRIPFLAIYVVFAVPVPVPIRLSDLCEHVSCPEVT